MSKTITIAFPAMGTVNSISVSGCTDEAAVRQAASRVQELHQRLSVFNEDSDLAAINAASGKKFVPVHPDTAKLLQKAKAYAQMTDGAFDPTIRPLVATWDIKKRTTVPDDKEIRKARRLTNYKDILIDPQSNRVMLRRRNMALDLGGIAKGFAADEVRRILLGNGIGEAVINLGGTVILLGSPKAMGIQHPDRQTGIPMGSLFLTNQVAVTSGSYEKFLIKNGKRYHHLLDPSSGYPAESGLKSVTLIGDSGLELDALSTAVFVLGAAKGSKIIEKFNLQALYITTDNQVFVTSGLKHMVTLTQNREVLYG